MTTVIAKIGRCLSVSAALLLLCTSAAAATPKLRYTSRPGGAKVTIEGTSTIHDWVTEGKLIGGFFEVDSSFRTDPLLTSLQDGSAEPPTVEVFIPVTSLRSTVLAGREKMDEVMREAMRASEHPRITYKLASLRVKGLVPPSGTPVQFDTKGQLQVAGVTNNIDMEVTMERLDGDRLRFTGTKRLKMTDFKIAPPAPKLALGLIKTGDEVTIKFEWTIAAAPTSSVPSTALAQELVPLPLQLPAEVFLGTPTDIDLDAKLREPPTDKRRPPFLAPKGARNLALNKKVASSDPSPISGALHLITDGDKEATDDGFVELHRKTQWVQIDLERPCRIYAILIWHTHNVFQYYQDVIVQVSNDSEFARDVTTLFNNDQDNSSGLGIGTDKEYLEKHEGKLIDAKGTVARYVRCYSRGSTYSSLNRYTEIEVWALPE